MCLISHYSNSNRKSNNRGVDKRFESVIPFMKHRCANIGGTLQLFYKPPSSPYLFARDDLFTNKSHPRRKSGQKSNVFLPVPCKFTRHFTRRTFQNDNDTRYTPTLFLETKYGNLIFLGKQLRFTRGNDEDVWENMYGDACGILTGKGKFCYTLVSRFPWVSME